MKIFSILFITLIIFSSCKKQEMKEIQHTVGDYIVSVSYSPDEFKKGYGSLFIEFRTSENKLINVENLSVNASMEGMSMSGETSVLSTDTPGRYEVKYNFLMKGEWLFNINFGNGMHAQFLLNVL